jgi:elongation factor G
MERYDIKLIRNIALVSHAGAGKTSLVDTILFSTGATSRLGRVYEGTSICDYQPDEIERKISINAKVLYCLWKGHRITLIDTPGYADFVAEVRGALRAVDGAVVLIDGVNGVEVGTERVWSFLDELSLPRIIFINKMEKENVSFFNTLKDLRHRFSVKCVPIQYPQGEGASFKGSIDLISKANWETLSEKEKTKVEDLRNELLETVAEADDALLEKYLEGKELGLEEIYSALKKMTLACKVVPLLCGSAITNLAIQPLLEAITHYLPSPAERSGVKGINPKTKQERTLAPDENGAFSAFVFKTISDPYVGQLTLFRVFSGSLASDTGFYNLSKGTRERIGQVYLLQGKEQRPIPKAYPGDIVAVAKLKDTSTGDTLGDEKDPLIFEPIFFPEPSISASVKPRSRGDEEKISSALARLASEDPTFRVTRDFQTKELIISGVGDLHLEIMVERMKARYAVAVDMGTPKVPYKETVTKTVRVQGKYKRQSGGRGQYGDVWIEVEPLTRGKEFEFVDKIVGGAIPRNYIPAVEKGIRQAMSEGVLAGYPLVDLRVSLYDGSYHTVDSSDLAFQIAGAMALRKGALEASPVLLEPVMEVEVSVPEEYIGQISGDLNSRRGRILGVEPRSKMQTIKALVPQAEMFKYATELRSMTQGRGFYAMKFSHYEEVPQRFASTIIAKPR